MSGNAPHASQTSHTFPPHDIVEIVAVRREPGAPGPETTVIRLLALLPSHWESTPLVEPGRVRLCIRLTGTDGPGAVRETVAAVLADPALRGWSEERADRGTR
ncbi:hypothetical protein LHJ74_07100 [Streptomyces sp. N2-109]|uniref:Uncharacterized protein n=1 Tax=Streptomyces gossypii TaxID=2883101 RepID=A0ABT2JQQ2_9ACTN|nr:hypothetical protein [Streptomyces gossypii]MCT2589690.1 hypothetical protein [Streptomyces gossypii]